MRVVDLHVGQVRSGANNTEIISSQGGVQLDTAFLIEGHIRTKGGPYRGTHLHVNWLSEQDKCEV